MRITNTVKTRDGYEIFAFEKGFELLPSEMDKLQARAELMHALEIKSDISWRRYLYGATSLTAAKYIYIRDYFAKKGVSECFGFKPEN